MKRYPPYIAAILMIAFAAGAIFAEPTYILKAEKEPIDEFLRKVAEITGRNFLIDPSVQGTVTFISPKPLTKEQVWEVAQSALSLNGFAVVEYGAIIKVIPKDKVASEPIPTRFNETPTPTETMITEIIELQYITPSEAIDSVQVLLGPGGTIVAAPGKSAIVVVDSEANIARIKNMVSRFDVRSASQGVTVIHLTYAASSQVAQLMTELFAKTGGVSGDGCPCRFTNDVRTNSLVVKAPAEETKAVKGLIGSLDNTEYSAHIKRLSQMDAESAKSLIQTLAGEP